jgi:hypothetical protein
MQIRKGCSIEFLSIRVIFGSWRIYKENVRRVVEMLLVLIWIGDEWVGWPGVYNIQNTNFFCCILLVTNVALIEHA